MSLKDIRSMKVLLDKEGERFENISPEELKELAAVLPAAKDEGLAIFYRWAVDQDIQLHPVIDQYGRVLSGAHWLITLLR